MYTVIGAVGSRALRVLWMLEELHLPYEHVPAKPRDPEIKARYGTTKIPVLLDGAAAVTDSVAIMTYLADKHSALTYPAGTIERAQQDAHTQFINDEMDRAFVGRCAPHICVARRTARARRERQLEMGIPTKPTAAGATFGGWRLLDGRHCDSARSLGSPLRRLGEKRKVPLGI